LAIFARLFTAVPDVHFYSLQKNPTPAEAEKVAAFPNVTNLGPAFQDFSDTAAAIASLDLVIAVDTSVAHLAGTMNKPVYMLLPLSPDWRWLIGRTDSPWYPTMTLFRQKRVGDWSAPLADIEARLAQG
jgi:ADP-heptose:LPS heptosyltransferase